MSEQIVILFIIILIDLVLAADNAIIIGMLDSKFEPSIRKKIFFWGISAAVLLRIVFTLLTAYLLQIKGLKLVGGLILLWVVYRLYKDVIKKEEKKEIRLKNKKRQRELYYSDPEWRERNNKRGRIYYRDNAEKVFNRKKNYYNKSIPPGVYVIKNIVTDEILYVGESSVPRHRWDRHKSIQENATSPISKLITSGELNKDHIDISIIEEIKDRKERLEREKYWIEKLNPSLNIKK